MKPVSDRDLDGLEANARDPHGDYGGVNESMISIACELRALRAMRDGLVAWRADMDAATLDHGGPRACRSSAAWQRAA